MSGQFLYFLPGRGAASERILIELGLDDRLSFREIHRRGVQGSGPNGGPGVICVSNALETERVGYWPDRQQWRRAGDYYLGFEPDDPPGPSDLSRGDPGIRGIPIKLADDREWIIAPGNRRSDQPWLPYYRDLQDDGSHSIRIVDQYDPYIDAVQVAFEKLVEAEGDLDQFSQMMTDDQTWDLAYVALAVAYRITKWEINALRLLNTTVVGNVVMAALDYREYAKMVAAKARADDARKKNDPGPEPGSEALDISPIARGATG